MPLFFKKAVLAMAGAAVLVFLAVPPCAAVPEGTPRVSFGLGATAGYLDTQVTGSDSMSWESGTVAGCGIIFEYMWNERFGVHSGVWAMLFQNVVSFDDGTQDIDATSRVVTVPLQLITSFRTRGGRFACDFLTGFLFSYVQKSDFRADDEVSGEKSADITRYIDKNQIGVGGGIELKFGITRFVDIFVGGMAEYYLTDFIDSEAKSDTRFFDFRATAGVLFRTF